MRGRAWLIQEYFCRYALEKSTSPSPKHCHLYDVRHHLAVPQGLVVSPRSMALLAPRATTSTPAISQGSSWQQQLKLCLRPHGDTHP